MKKSLVLLRGLPGSGKSTLAQLFDCPVVEADQYFMKDGEYNHDHNLLHEAHQWCKNKVETLMKNDEVKIAVANTFIEEFEITQYYMLAEKYDYTVFTTMVENRHGNKNIHNVSDDMVERMKYKIETNKKSIVWCETTPIFDKGELDGYVSEKLLSVQTHQHPKFDFSIYNYTKQAEYYRWWNSTSLQCRGLVLNSGGEVVARPFKKFFNFEDVYHKVDISDKKSSYEIFDKLDGSLGMLFNYKGEWVFSSRGSFDSEQSKEGFRFLKNYDYKSLDTDYTYMFEIIYPNNRIIIDYSGEEDIILLGAIHTESGEEMTYNKIVNNSAGFNTVNKNDDLVGMTLSELKDLDIEGKEGYVVKIGDVRVKVKFKNYFEKHSIIADVSSYDIWENILSNRSVSDMVKEIDIPDEFYDWMQKVEDNILMECDNIVSLHQDIYDKIKGIDDRKDFAEAVLRIKNPQINKGYLFSLRDGVDIRNKVLKTIKPEYELPFKK
jgi:RNA ligase